MPTLMRPITPRGAIVKFTGLIANIPNGWALCDGNNGTPDMRARFSRGINTNATNPTTTGGEDSHVLTTAELPVHNHGTTESGHTHTAGGEENAGAGTNRGNEAIKIASSLNSAGSLNTGNASLAGVSVGNTGGGLGHENRPAYYEVLFIMKVSDY